MLRLFISLVGVWLCLAQSRPLCSTPQTGLAHELHARDHHKPQHDSQCINAVVSDEAEKRPALLQAKYAGWSSPTQNTQFFEEDPFNSSPRINEQIVAEPPLPFDSSPTTEARNNLVNPLPPFGRSSDINIDQARELEQTPNFMLMSEPEQHTKQEESNDPSQDANKEMPNLDELNIKEAQPVANEPEGEIEQVVDNLEDAAHKIENAAREGKREDEADVIATSRAEVPMEFPPSGRATATTESIKVGEWVPQHSDHCNPVCTWSCSIPKCDEVCSPVCQAPRCETRCSGMSTYGCVMACAKPKCMVMCPKAGCPSGGCPTCTTQCSEPECHMKCPKSKLCKSMCEQPQCEWNCKVPQCPKPKCHMVCESPKKCGNASFTQELPPLLPGQTAVDSFVASVPPAENKGGKPMSVFQSASEIQKVPWTSPSFMNVRVRSMGGDRPVPGRTRVVPETNMVTLPVLQEQQINAQAGVHWGPN